MYDHDRHLDLLILIFSFLDQNLDNGDDRHLLPGAPPLREVDSAEPSLPD